MFFGLIPFALGYGLGTLASPRYFSYSAYPPYAPYPYAAYPYPYQRWY